MRSPQFLPTALVVISLILVAGCTVGSLSSDDTEAARAQLAEIAYPGATRGEVERKLADVFRLRDERAIQRRSVLSAPERQVDGTTVIVTQSLHVVLRKCRLPFSPELVDALVAEIFFDSEERCVEFRVEREVWK